MLLPRQAQLPGHMLSPAGEHLHLLGNDLRYQPPPHCRGVGSEADITRLMAQSLPVLVAQWPTDTTEDPLLCKNSDEPLLHLQLQVVHARAKASFARNPVDSVKGLIRASFLTLSAGLSATPRYQTVSGSGSQKKRKKKQPCSRLYLPRRFDQCPVAILLLSRSPRAETKYKHIPPRACASSVF